MESRRQLTFFPELEGHAPQRPVNVASVPLRSPFRYPGGKTWFVPTFRDWLFHLGRKPAMLIEPFVGGGIISLTALFENLVSRAIMVELDEDIAAVWEAVVQGDADWIAQKILAFDLTHETLSAELAQHPHEVKRRAFQTILKNRTLHGGILAEGSGFIKDGENGKGIQSRWYPSTLAKRFSNLNLVVDRITFRRDDGLKVIEEYTGERGAVFFIDPPYTAGGKKAGRRLYRYYELDHKRLFALCQSLEGDFLMTYDNAEEVRRLAFQYGFQMRLIPMKNTHHATMEELLIGKDLAWLDHYSKVHEPAVEYETDRKKSNNLEVE